MTRVSLLRAIKDDYDVLKMISYCTKSKECERRECQDKVLCFKEEFKKQI